MIKENILFFKFKAKNNPLNKIKNTAEGKQMMFFTVCIKFYNLCIFMNSFTDGCQNSKYNVSRKREVVQTIQDINDVTGPGGSKS